MLGGAGRLIALVGLSFLLSSAPRSAIAQVFIASQPKPDFTIGPLFVRANVGPKAGPIDVTVLFSVVPSAAPGEGHTDTGSLSPLARRGRRRDGRGRSRPRAPPRRRGARISGVARRATAPLGARGGLRTAAPQDR